MFETLNGTLSDTLEQTLGRFQRQEFRVVEHRPAQEKVSPVDIVRRDALGRDEEQAALYVPTSPPTRRDTRGWARWFHTAQHQAGFHLRQRRHPVGRHMTPATRLAMRLEDNPNGQRHRVPEEPTFGKDPTADRQPSKELQVNAQFCLETREGDGRTEPPRPSPPRPVPTLRSR